MLDTATEALVEVRDVPLVAPIHNSRRSFILFNEGKQERLVDVALFFFLFEGLHKKLKVLFYCG